MRFCRKSNGRVGNSGCELCECVPRARLDYERVQELFRTYRLGFGECRYRFSAADTFYLVNKAACGAEARIRAVSVVAHYRDDVVFLRQFLYYRNDSFESAKGTAQSEAYLFSVHTAPPESFFTIASATASPAETGEVFPGSENALITVKPFFFAFSKSTP